MSDVYLTRVDERLNMARYYRMSLQPTLFGEWAVVREWGRIGRGGQVRNVSYSSYEQGLKALTNLTTQKLRRGYGLMPR